MRLIHNHNSTCTTDSFANLAHQGVSLTGVYRLALRRTSTWVLPEDISNVRKVMSDELAECFDSPLGFEHRYHQRTQSLVFPISKVASQASRKPGAERVVSGVRIPSDCYKRLETSIRQLATQPIRIDLLRLGRSSRISSYSTLELKSLAQQSEMTLYAPKPGQAPEREQGANRSSSIPLQFVFPLGLRKHGVADCHPLSHTAECRAMAQNNTV